MNVLLSPAAIAAIATTLILIALDLVMVLRSTLLAGRSMPRWMAYLPAAALVAMVAQIAANLAFNPIFVFMSAPLYLATLVFVAGGILRGGVWLVRWTLKRNRPAATPRLSLPRAGLSVLCATLLLLGAVRWAQTYAFAAGIAGHIATLEAAPGGADLSERSMSEAFRGLAGTLKTQYPFTEHKSIDWESLYAEFAPRIAAAKSRRDSAAYYRTLREFAWRIPDAHIGIEGDDHGLEQAEIGGSYGLSLFQLDDGRVLVRDVSRGGPAAQEGIVAGAELVGWNGMPIEQALTGATIIWSEAPPATKESKRLLRVRFLSRAPAGARAAVAFRNPGRQSVATANLSAVGAALEQHGDLGPAGLVIPSVTGRVLASGYGYIRVRNEMPNLAGFPDQQMRRAVAGLIERDVPGIIVDVRDNLGGESRLAANMLSVFQPEQRLYQYLGLPDRAGGRFRPVTSSPLMIEPASTQYHGPVAVLIDEYSHSAAEDFAQVLQDLPNGFAVGMSGTAAAGGTSEAVVRLPGGYSFAFPKAQSLDRSFRIQIESDFAGNGGVLPDIRVPRNDDTAAGLSAGQDVVLEHAEVALHEYVASGSAEILQFTSDVAGD